MWALYFYLIFFIFYLRSYKKSGSYENFIYFLLTTLILHVLTGIYWIKEAGIFFPFFKYHSATYPYKLEELPRLWSIYPTYIFKGSYINTTLFGEIPYLLIILLFVKLIMSRKMRKNKFDELDFLLLSLYSIFLLFLNFIPDTPLKFDQYYSVPRIFRYLYPISFPISLHLSKIIIDLISDLISNDKQKMLLTVVISILIFLNIFRADEATLPGRKYRLQLLSIVNDVKEIKPPTLLVDSWIGYFMREVYLRDSNIYIEPIIGIYDAKEYEKWLKENEEKLPVGSVIVANFGSCVHYGCYNCGFQLHLFNESLSEKWVLVKEYEYLKFSNQKPSLWIVKKD